MRLASCENTSSEKPKIVIIGAGLAGLTTAYRLFEKGYDIEIYEARPRVGGRVHSVFIKSLEGEDSIAELGGHDISDGGKAHYMLSLIREFNLEIREDITKLSHIFYEDRKIHTPHIFLQQQDFAPQKLEEFFYHLKTSVHSIQDILDILFKKDSILKRYFSIRISLYEGSDPSLLAVYHNKDTLKHLLQRGLPPAHPKSIIHRLVIKEGNAQLPLKMAQKISHRLHLEKILKKVRINSSHQIEVSFQDNKSIFCDKLILAIPCSVYKNIIFDEAVLPAARLTSIKEVQYGTNAKILASVKRLNSPYNAVFTNKMVGFFSNEDKLLNMYFGGQAAATLSKNTLDLFQETLIDMKAGFKNILLNEEEPISAKDEQLTRHIQPVAKSWTEDPYSQGSYSNYGVKLGERFSEETDYHGIKFKKIFEPIANRIFFAGEHATLLDEIGTMEAAVESGERLALLF
jgi:monoamine oxidase